MPEMKHTFTGGKMDKDNDERIISNGQYREALNIQVATSDGSDVGAAQNILGNLKQTFAVSGHNNKYADANLHIAHTVDPFTDSVYRFINTPSGNTGVWMDRIVEFNTQGTGDSSGSNGIIFDPKYNEKAVAIDIYKVRTILTGVSTTACGTEVFLDFTTNVFQLRWGMKLTRVVNEIPKEDLSRWGVYINSIEIIDDGTGLTPAAIRCKMNNPEAEFALDPLSGDRIPPYYDDNGSMIPVELFSLIGKKFIFEADRNLNFSPKRNITGINIIDGMLFWTDNYSEPKKINIKRGKQGSTFQHWDTFRDTRLASGVFDIGDFDQQTRLIVKDKNPTDCMIINSKCGAAIPDNPEPQTNCTGANTFESGNKCRCNEGFVAPGAFNSATGEPGCYSDTQIATSPFGIGKQVTLPPKNTKPIGVVKQNKPPPRTNTSSYD